MPIAIPLPPTPEPTWSDVTISGLLVEEHTSDLLLVEAAGDGGEAVVLVEAPANVVIVGGG